MGRDNLDHTLDVAADALDYSWESSVELLWGEKEEWHYADF